MQENKDPIKEFLGKGKKKILLIFASALLALFLFFMVAAVTAIIIYPVIKGGQLVAGVAGLWDRLTNTITLKCLFCSTETLAVKKEEKFYKKVDKLNDTYLSGKNMKTDFIQLGIVYDMIPVEQPHSIQLDIPLLLSVIFYVEDIEDTIFKDADITDKSTEDSNVYDEEKDFLGNLSWYYDQSDQRAIKWFMGKTEEEGCYILGYYYHTEEQYPLIRKSKLRQIAKHMVKKIRNGTCTPVYNDAGDFIGWHIEEWSEFILDINRDDSLYTMEFDQQPYKPYRSKAEVESLPPSFIIYLLAKYLPDQFNDLLPKEVKDLSKEHESYLAKRKVMKNTIYSYKKAYEYLVGDKYESGDFCNELGENCSYSVKNLENKMVNVRNLKVQLLQCGNSGNPMPGEELIDFEKYITGVTYGETGGAPLEAMKAESIAARSYALTRGEKMGVNFLKIYQENGQWILPIRNCTDEQVYCDPDKGCTIYENGRKVLSGKQDGGTYKPPLSEDSSIRKAVAETVGKVLVDSSGNILYTPYSTTDHNKWIDAAKNGSDAYQILAEKYGTDNVLKSSCSGTGGCYTGSAGEYLAWRQWDQQWANISVGTGDSTIAQIGCLVTTVAKLISVSGTKVTISNFNPGTMVKYLNTHGGFSGSNFKWASPQTSGLAPNFVHVGSISLKGMTEVQKILTVKSYLDQGFYLALQVKCDGTEEPGQHWVAVTGVTSRDIMMSDPNSSNTTVWSKYKSGGTVQFHYYKKTD